MSDEYYKWYMPDKNVVVDCILCSDKEVVGMLDALKQKKAGPDGEQRHRIIKSLLKSKLSEKRDDLMKKNVVELNEILQKLRGWPTSEKVVCVPSTPKRLSQRMKDKIKQSKMAQRRNAPLKEQWSFLQWTKKAERDCKFAALRQKDREAKEKDAIEQMLKK